MKQIVDAQTEREIIYAMFDLREHKKPISKKAVARKLRLTVTQIAQVLERDYTLQSIFQEIKSH